MAIVGPDTDMVTIIFDDDMTLSGEGGNDVVYGDTAQIEISAKGVIDIGPITSSDKDFDFGDETHPGGIFGGGGNDLLYGDLSDITLIAKGLDNFTLLSDFEGSASIKDNAFDFGDDFLSGDSGKDTIYGDLNLIELIATGGDVVTDIEIPALNVSNATIESNQFNFGSDTLNGGAGSDVLLGDMKSLLLNATGGLNVLGFLPLSISNAEITNNTFNFGIDILNGGGNSDTVFGDLISIKLTATGGTDIISTDGNADAIISGNIITLGADMINGGKGSDVLFGDLSELILTATPGENDPSGDAIIEFNQFIFGSDIIMGGSGSDTIYGDFLTLQLVGPITNISDTPANSYEDESGNIVTFGNDELSGGAGHDTFSFTLLPFDEEPEVPSPDSMIMPGDDVLSDFSFKDDTIQFVDVFELDGVAGVDINDLEATTIVSEADDDVFIQFLTPSLELIGSITILNAADSGVFNSILDLADVIEIIPAM